MPQIFEVNRANEIAFQSTIYSGDGNTAHDILKYRCTRTYNGQTRLTKKRFNSKVFLSECGPCSEKVVNNGSMKSFPIIF